LLRPLGHASGPKVTTNGRFDGLRRGISAYCCKAAQGRSCQSTPRAESGPSLQVRDRKGSEKKADTQGISQFFLLRKRSEWRLGAYFVEKLQYRVFRSNLRE
jgi:hypothetical protein